VGGLGSSAALRMAAMGVGYIRLVDRDVVSKSDLHRQSIYDESVIGVPKVEAAAAKISALNSDVRVDEMAASIAPDNVEKLIDGVDVIIDGLDNMQARYAVNRAALRLKIPYIFAAAIRTYGNVSTIIPGETACLECFHSGYRDERFSKCAVVGVFPPVLDIASSIEVSEVIRILLGKEPHLKNRLFYIDLNSFSFDVIELAKASNCPVCGKGVVEAPPLEAKVVNGVCGRDGRGVFIITNLGDLDIGQIYTKLKACGVSVKMKTNLGITFNHGDKVSISALKGGVMIIEAAPTSGVYDEESALQLYQKVARQIDLPYVKRSPKRRT